MTIRMDPGGRQGLLAVFACFAIVAWVLELFAAIPAVAAAGIAVWIVLYTGRLEITDSEVRWKRNLLWPTRVIRVQELRHIRRSTPWIATAFQDAVTLEDDAGRRIRLPARMSEPHRLHAWISETARWIVQRKRVEEARETLKMVFRCPGSRWLAHLLAFVGAVAGAGVGVGTAALILRLRSDPGVQVILGLSGAAVIGALIGGVRHGSWIGAELILTMNGIEVRRVDSHRRHAWSSVRRAGVDLAKRVVIEVDASTAIRLPEGIEDRELVPLFVDVGRRRALSRES